MKSVNTNTKQKRTSVRMVAIVVCVIAIVATAVFGVIERVNVEQRLDAIEQSNQQTAAALAATASNNNLFEKNYRLTVELFDAMKKMSRNMKDMTAAFKRASDARVRKARRAKIRRHGRRVSGNSLEKHTYSANRAARSQVEEIEGT